MKKLVQVIYFIIQSVHLLMYLYSHVIYWSSIVSDSQITQVVIGFDSSSAVLGDFEESEICDLGCKYAEWGQWESFARYENNVQQTFLPDLDPATGEPTGTGARTAIPPIYTYTCIRISST